jgi:hypothetical protein
MRWDAFSAWREKLSDMIGIYRIQDGGMKEESDWNVKVKGLLNAELKRRSVTDNQLAERLKEVRVNETLAEIANKIGRSRFTAVFLLQCILVVGCSSLQLSDA